MDDEIEVDREDLEVDMHPILQVVYLLTFIGLVISILSAAAFGQRMAETGRPVMAAILLVSAFAGMLFGVVVDCVIHPKLVKQAKRTAVEEFQNPEDYR